MWIDRWGRLRKNLLPCGCLNHLHGAFLPDFLLASHLICLVLSLYLAYLRVLMCVQLLALLWGGAPSLLTSEKLLHIYGWEGLLDLENEKYAVFYLSRA